MNVLSVMKLFSYQPFDQPFLFTVQILQKKAKLNIPNSKLKFFLGVSNRQKSKGPRGSPDFHFYYLFMYHSLVWMNVLDVMKLFSYHTFWSALFLKLSKFGQKAKLKMKVFFGGVSNRQKPG
jgi:hypothetical protein